MRKGCARARGALERARDGGHPVSPARRGHIDGCRDCAEYEQGLASLGAALRAALDQELGSLPAPDPRAVAARVGSKARRRWPRLAPPSLPLPRVFAAAFVLAAAVGVGTLIGRGEVIRVSVGRSTDWLVDSVFRTPLLEGAELAPATFYQDTEWLTPPPLDTGLFPRAR